MSFKLLSVVLAVASMAALGIGGTLAVFSDVETSTDNLMEAGSLNLEMDVGGVPLPDGVDTVVIELEDMVPGDDGERTLSFKNAGSISGNLTVTITRGADLENTIIEPEATAGDTTAEGELSSQVGVVIWRDDFADPAAAPPVLAGDNVLQVEETILYAGKLNVMDSPLTAISSEPTSAGVTKYIGISWVFQEHPAGPGDPKDNNQAQTDSVTIDIMASLVQP